MNGKGMGHGGREAGVGRGLGCVHSVGPMCSVWQANVFSFLPNVFSFRPDVFTLAGQVFSFRRCASARLRRPRGGDVARSARRNRWGVWGGSTT